MGMTVTLDRMIHTNAVHHELDKEIGLEGCCAFGGKGLDLNPIDLMAMGLASCLMIVMAKSAESKGLDLTGTWAETGYTLKDYKITSFDGHHSFAVFPFWSRADFPGAGELRCPVYLSVKDSVNVKLAFEWADKSAPAAKKTAKSCSQCA